MPFGKRSIICASDTASSARGNCGATTSQPTRIKPSASCGSTIDRGISSAPGSRIRSAT